MSSIQNFFTSRDNNANASTYVGQTDRLWYNPADNIIYVSDGTTPGGKPVTVGGGNSNVSFNIVTANTLTSQSGTLNLTGNINITGNISAATTTKIGGVRAGPGANISDTGLLTIDSANIPFSFGNFFANNNILSIVNANEDMVLATDGNAEIQLVGNIGFYKTDGIPPTTADRYFYATEDGQVTLLVSAVDPAAGAVRIVGSSSGVVQSPVVSGTMLHVTGQNNLISRIYNDSISNYSVWIGRRYNGTAMAPTPVLAGDSITRFGATTYTSGNTFTPLGVARFDFIALEDQTPTAQGAKVVLSMSAIGGNTAITSATWTADGMTGNVTGNLTGTTVSITGNISSGNILTSGIVSATGNIAAGNILTSGVVSATGNITTANTFVGNISGLVTHRVRDAGDVTGTTLTLNVTTDDIVKCTFDNNFTVGFSSIIAGRTVTLIATNTSAADNDIITAGISAVNMQGDNTLTVTQQTTSVITYYSTGTTTGNIFASAVYG